MERRRAPPRETRRRVTGPEGRRGLLLDRLAVVMMYHLVPRGLASPRHWPPCHWRSGRGSSRLLAQVLPGPRCSACSIQPRAGGGRVEISAGHLSMHLVAQVGAAWPSSGVNMYRVMPFSSTMISASRRVGERDGGAASRGSRGGRSRGRSRWGRRGRGGGRRRAARARGEREPDGERDESLLLHPEVSSWIAWSSTTLAGATGFRRAASDFEHEPAAPQRAVLVRVRGLTPLP